MLKNILNTIINNDNVVYDENKPYSFITFLKYYDNAVDIKTIISEYEEYIQQWCVTKNNQYNIDIYKQIIQQQYIALLQEITLDYTTVEEKRFLSSLTFNEETIQNTDKLNSLLDIILPFYIEKINNICKYYINKRNEYKANLQIDKVISSPLALKKMVKNIILDELESNNNEYSSVPLSALNDISQILEVDVVNLYDNKDYFDKYDSYDPNNTNDINFKLFEDYDSSIIEAIRQYPFYLVDNNIFCFSVNPQLTTEDVNFLPIKDFIYHTKSNNTEDTILNLQKQLVEKFTGSDYYYISTDENNTPVSGLLVQADNNITNLLNIDILNTPTIDNGVYDDIRRIGLNFTPDKFGLLFYNTDNLSYSIDNTKLQPNSLYVFPDPNKYSRYDTPLIWYIDTSKDKQNYSLQYGFGRPKSDPLLQYFYSYFSTNQKQDTSNTQLITFKNNFESILNDKIITNYKYDIFGNEYALFKYDSYYKNPNKNNVNNEPTNNYEYTNLILNGETINNDCAYYEAININYPIEQIIYYTLDMGGFVDNNFDNDVNTNSKYSYYNICVDGNELLIDGSFSYNTNTPNWPNLPNINYNMLLDGGISGYNIIGEDNINIKYPVGSLALNTVNIQYDDYSIEYDCGLFYTNTYKELQNTIIERPNNTVKSEIPTTSQETSSIIQQNNDLGELYFKNAYTNEILPCNIALSAIFEKYNIPSNDEYIAIYNELIDNQIQSFDIINDVIIITTKNYIVYDKIVFENNEIIKSIYTNNYIKLMNDTNDQHYFNKPSSYFYIEQLNKIAYVQLTYMDSEELTSSELSATDISRVIYPVLNLIDINNLTKEQLKLQAVPEFIVEQFNWNEIYNNGGTQIEIMKISRPLLIYNSLNNLYNLCMMCYDNMNYPYFYNISFVYNVDDIILYSNRFYMIDRSTTRISSSQILGTTKGEIVL